MERICNPSPGLQRGASVEALEGRRHLDAALLPGVSVAMSGLDNPRGLDFGPQGALYVAEAGRGGGPTGPSVVQRGATFHYGPTGAVSRLWRGEQERVATGLPSLALANGNRGIGPMDVSLHGVGNAYVAVGLEGDPAQRAELGDAGDGFASLVRLKNNGTWDFVADVGTYEATVNPDPRVVDSNPYGLLAEGGGRVVVDAGGNSILRVGNGGNISTLAVIPPLPPGAAVSSDPVPTSIAVGPDGAYYVGILSGAPFRDGAANVYRVVPGETPTVYLGGFKAILDIAFDDAGNLYVVQHASGAVGLAGPGSVVRVAPDGTRTTVLAGLNQPTSVAVGPGGALYVTEFGQSAGVGRVLRVDRAALAAPATPPLFSQSRIADGDGDDETIGALILS